MNEIYRLRSSDPIERRWAILALGCRTDPDAREALYDASLHDPELGLRKLAYEAYLYSRDGPCEATIVFMDAFSASHTDYHAAPQYTAKDVEPDLPTTLRAIGINAGLHFVTALFALLAYKAYQVLPGNVLVVGAFLYGIVGLLVFLMWILLAHGAATKLMGGEGSSNSLIVDTSGFPVLIVAFVFSFLLIFSGGVLEIPYNLDKFRVMDIPKPFRNVYGIGAGSGWLLTFMYLVLEAGWVVTGIKLLLALKPNEA